MKIEFLSFFVGAGFPDESAACAATLPLDFIGADAGTIDVGPYQLAGDGTIFSADLCRNDLRRVLPICRAKGIPLVIGSCGGGGTDWGVDWFAGMVREIADELNLAPFRMARIYAEPERAWLREKANAGKLRPLGGTSLPYGGEEIDRSTRIVTVMGAEPFVEALGQGADVVLAGRTTDSAIFAAIPLMRGVDKATAWHAGKVAECGGAIGEPARNDLLHVVIDDAGFVVTPLARDARCTPWSVAAHQLYENADPTLFVEPSGTLDAARADFVAEGARSVRITGGAFTEAARYTMKLEGVEPAGYQSIAFASYNDPVLLAELEEWLDAVKAEIAKKVFRVYGAKADDARITIRTYGAANGSDLFHGPRLPVPSSDAFFLIDVVAPSQAMATAAATAAWHTLIHFPPKGWSGSFVTAAWPFNPPVIERGLLHRFNVNHVVEVDSPFEPLRFVYEDVR